MSSNIHPIRPGFPPIPPEPEKKGGDVPACKRQDDAHISPVGQENRNRPCKSRMRAFGRAHPHPCQGVTTTTMGTVTTTTMSPVTTTTISSPSTTTIGAPSTTTIGAPTTTTMSAPSTTTAMPPLPPKCPPPHRHH